MIVPPMPKLLKIALFVEPVSGKLRLLEEPDGFDVEAVVTEDVCAGADEVVAEVEAAGADEVVAEVVVAGVEALTVTFDVALAEALPPFELFEDGVELLL